jgi:hypothetical protein
MVGLIPIFGRAPLKRFTGALALRLDTSAIVSSSKKLYERCSKIEVFEQQPLKIPQLRGLPAGLRSGIRFHRTGSKRRAGPFIFNPSYPGGPF